MSSLRWKNELGDATGHLDAVGKVPLSMTNAPARRLIAKSRTQTEDAAVAARLLRDFDGSRLATGKLDTVDDFLANELAELNTGYVGGGTGMSDTHLDSFVKRELAALNRAQSTRVPSAATGSLFNFGYAGATGEITGGCEYQQFAKRDLQRIENSGGLERNLMKTKKGDYVVRVLGENPGESTTMGLELFKQMVDHATHGCAGVAHIDACGKCAGSI